jgi:hypothetical protein
LGFGKFPESTFESMNVTLRLRGVASVVDNVNEDMESFPAVT